MGPARMCLTTKHGIREPKVKLRKSHFEPIGSVLPRIATSALPEIVEVVLGRPALHHPAATLTTPCSALAAVGVSTSNRSNR